MTSNFQDQKSHQIRKTQNNLLDTSIFCGILILEEGQGERRSKQKQNEFMNSLLCCVTLQNVHNISAKTQF